ncbi:MAG: Dam family site-specific DNA-(adenine-N6)-methyltransferase [Rickettsiella sp.]|nr:Dam family site-specific DNA-(adenine-N6)-methyltransferase [Rickettsiella sp.]
MKSFLKWAGNKYRIIEQIKFCLPKGKRLIEPFIGSATVFLNTLYPSYLLADSNRDLIHLYQKLQEEGQSFINYCRIFFDSNFNNAEEFYRLRRLFNDSKENRIRAALLLYLNKHCFNGLARFNKKGQFNTPFSCYKSPYFPEKEMQFFYKQSKLAQIIHADFSSTLTLAKRGDVVYCDPPYVGLSKTANFTHYTADGFNKDQQIKLANTAKALASRGITVIISNHDTEFTRNIYQGAILFPFSVQRNISSKGSQREKAAELLAIFK